MHFKNPGIEEGNSQLSQSIADVASSTYLYIAQPNSSCAGHPLMRHLWFNSFRTWQIGFDDLAIFHMNMIVENIAIESMEV